MKNICGNNIWLWFCRSFRACFSSGVAIPGDTGDLQPPIRRALFQRLFQSLCPLQGNTVFNPERAIFSAAFGEIYYITK